LSDLGDLEGYKDDFLKIFGFGLSDVDYDEDLDPSLGRLG
jgi:enoyl-[acyl-carrier protein] reductase/trans-2-enoyl-CoA reductase (NAD+)